MNEVVTFSEKIERIISASTVSMENSTNKIAFLFDHGPIIEAILQYLPPGDSIEFLSCTKYSYNSECGWKVMVSILEIKDYMDLAKLSAFFNIQTNNEYRELVIYSVKKLGYNCVNCYVPLDGKLEHGLFAAASLCTSCAIEKFKMENSPYVDGIIRFYLSGEDSITLKGKAFLEHPFWLSVDDVYERVKTSFGSAYELAQSIYAEKTFFKTFAPTISRPRDDKQLTLSLMIEADIESRRNIKSNRTHQMHPLASFFSRFNFNSSHAPQHSVDTSSAVDEDLKPHFFDHLPVSLKAIYFEQVKRKQSGLTKPSLLGTLPLRELVKSMHERESSGNHIKKL